MKTLCFAAALLTLTPVLRAEKLEDWLRKLRDPAAAVRREAWQRAEHQGAEAVLPLVKLASGDDRDLRLAALRSLERIAHAAAAPSSDRREAVAAELAKGLSESAALPEVRAQLLDLLGSVGSGAQVDAVAPILLDSRLRDAARRALRRIPGTRATTALAEAARVQTGDFLEALVWTLAERRDPEAVPLLAELARRGPRPARVAAARALIRIGDEAAREAVVAVMPEATPRDRSAISADLIDYAHRLRAGGKAAMADGLFGVILANASEPQHRSAALLGLCADDPASYLDLLVSLVDSREESLRRLALSMLTDAKGDGVDRSLLIDYAVTEGGRRAALLSVLARRKLEGVERLVEAAALEEDLDLRVTALSLSGRLGSVELEPLIFQAVREGSPEVRAVALESYLELAEEVAKTDAAAAASMFTNILDHSDDGGVLSRSLLGLGATGTELAADRIRASMEIPQLARDAERARLRYAIAIGKGGEKERAIELLTSSVASGHLPREELREAIAGLEALGADPTILQKRRGLVTDWWYLGPFPNEGGKGFSTAYSPEEGVDLKSQKDDRGRDRKWGEHRTTHLDGIVDFERLFRRTQNVLAYLYTEIEMPEARELTLKIGSDDGYVCWLNGERVHGNDVIRPLAADQDSFRAKFRKGKNRLLLKVTQGGGQWALVLRLSDAEGKPIDLNRGK